MKIVEDIVECKKLWDKYSPHKTLWDDWEVVESFFNPRYNSPYFIDFGDGILPLWYDIKEKRYEFFGGSYPEGRKFWFDESKLPEIFDKIPSPLRLFDMDGDYVEELVLKFPILQNNVELDYSFYINLEEINWEIENYLSRFSKKHRYNLLYDIKKSELRGIQKEWGGFKHFEKMVEFNVKRFAEESDFFDDDFSFEIKNFLNILNERGELYGLYILNENDKVVGLEYGVFSNGIYYVLNGGYSLEYQNVGKVLIMEHINKAIELKAKEIDLLTGDTGWKKMWNFSQKKRMTIKKNE